MPRRFCVRPGASGLPLLGALLPFAMSDLVLLSGSPSATSRSVAVLKDVESRLEALGLTTSFISVRDFPAEDLILARYDSPTFDRAKAEIEQAAGLVISTPVYKASYTGTLKTFLDILPQHALRGKVVLPLATGGTLAHLLAIDYSLKPVLCALGATELLQGVYSTDAQIKVYPGSPLWMEDELQSRLAQGVEQLASSVVLRRAPRSPG